MGLAVALAVATGAIAADIALDTAGRGATLYLERCAAPGAWRYPIALWQWAGEHLRAFPVSSAAMMLTCGWPDGTTRRGTAAMASRVAVMVVAMPVLCAVGLSTAAAMPANGQVAAYLATMWALSLGMDSMLGQRGAVGAVRRWRWRCR